MRRAIFLAAVLLALLAGSAVAASSPKAIVLRLQDMPTGFRVVKSVRVSAAAAAKDNQWTLRKMRRLGYTTGYKRDFRRDVSLSDLVKGAIEVGSLASVYRTSAGAHSSLKAAVKSCHKLPYHQLSIGAKIGNEAALCSTVKKSHGYTYQGYSVVWRRANLKASIEIVGLKGGTSPDQAVALAKIQDRRMR